MNTSVPLPVTTEVAAHLDMYRWMCLSRAIEDRLHKLFVQGRLRGRLISGRGQEAIPVGASIALRDGDVAAPVHRDLGVHLVRGTSPLAVFRHYFGCATGPSSGHDGDIHMGEWDKGVFPMVSQLPDSWPIVCGVGLGFRLSGSAAAALAFCGDGATSTGTWHEAVNFASVFDLPIVFIVENNQFAYSTPTIRQFRVAQLSERASSYGIPGMTVDGNDVLAVNEATTTALDLARCGGGPTLLEAMTMRMDGHAVHDAADYVPKHLLDQWATRDPIQLLGDRLTDRGIGRDVLDEIRRGQREEIEEAVQIAISDSNDSSRFRRRAVYALAAV